MLASFEESDAMMQHGFSRGRRRALALMLGAALAPWVAVGEARPEPRIGLALGSGGARGLAHILVFEVLDMLELRPHRIAGSSIGAVMGSLYAAGLSAQDIHDALDRVTVARDESWFQALLDRELTRWLRFVEPGFERGGLVKAEAFTEFLAETADVTAFEELEIPLRVVATDFWAREMVVFESGALWPAVRASMAMPGLFKPVSHQDTLLVDGGLTNPLPYDLLGDCDLVIAVDVLGTRTPDGSEVPSSLDSIFNTFQIMQAAILGEKLRKSPPDFLVRPDIQDVRVLDFHRFEDIFEQARPARDALEADLRQYLDRRS
ncbi:Patatin [Thioalkalivibrio nitratireducens DSM 14787]|uniref:Patatin n=1 Tax=Thioalkalivibrio nitratireducens (strain DSM 14787 / UNIQEM 213 / ALEN2) TaxID=1255043 RepID=L0DV54_THIND|nr:patatin-like phospholipase family protein [Thioalkalivibrio nitratireducens]AGA32877.1 Patatin [Thioalkalivibrio nitratireducens DSM 14787]